MGPPGAARDRGCGADRAGCAGRPGRRRAGCGAGARRCRGELGRGCTSSRRRSTWRAATSSARRPTDVPATRRARPRPSAPSAPGRPRPAGPTDHRAGRVGGPLEAGQLTRQVPRAPGRGNAGRAGQRGPGRMGHQHRRPSPRISARCCWRPKVVLDLHGVAPTVQLAGGPTAADAASIHTGSGQLAAHGITVTSVDPATGQPMPLGPGRPFVSVGGGGRLLATDATFNDLGSPADSGWATRRRVRRRQQWFAGAHRAAAQQHRAAAERQLRGPAGGRADRRVGGRTAWCCAATRAPGCARSRRAQRRQRRAGQRPEHGAADHRASATTGNGAFGVAVAGQTAPRIIGVSTRADGGRPAAVRRADAAVSGFTAVDQPIGVFTHAGAARVGLGRCAHHRRRARGGGGADHGRAAAERVPDRGHRGRGRGRRDGRPR